MIDRSLLVMVFRELNTVAVFAAEHDLSEAFRLNAVGDFETDDGLPKVDRFFKVSDVDAILIDAGLHGVNSS
jgi:hypothetical protein